MSKVTKSAKYKPTTAEKKLLEVLVNPDFSGKSITEICKEANVSRKKYYDAMSKEPFIALVNQITMDLIKGKASDVINATFKYAMTAKGHQDRKLILSIAGVIADQEKQSKLLDAQIEKAEAEAKILADKAEKLSAGGQTNDLLQALLDVKLGGDGSGANHIQSETD